MKTHLLSYTALALMIAASPAQQTTQTPAEKLGWKLAVHSYTFKQFPIFDAIDKTSSLGIPYMSISGSVNLDSAPKASTMSVGDKDLNAITEKLKARGIHDKFVNMGVVQLPADETQSRKVFEFAKKMGIEILVAEPAETAMDTVEKLCKEYNIKVAIHNHPKPSHYWNPDTVLAAIKGRSPLIGACADTGHWVRSGLDPLECLKKLQGHILCLHFKDLSEKSPKAHDVPWGTGISNAKGMMQELKTQGFKGAFCVEYEYHWENSSPEIAECAKFFDATCKELAGAP